MNDDAIAPAGDVSVEGQATQVAPQDDTQIDGGQGTNTGEGAISPEQQIQVPFEERLTGLFEKKGWNQDNWQQNILDSYESLETKLGNWSEVEGKAGKYDQLFTDATDWYSKAQMWDRAQARLAELEQSNQIGTGDFDVAKAPTETLAKLWSEGKIDISQIPPERQFQVQKHAMAMESAIEAENKAQAEKLVETNPILKNPKVANLVADKIEQGMDPQQAIDEVKSLFSEFEKKGEERIKQDIAMVKEGNLERTSSAAPTKPNRKITNVRDAFYAAKSELEGN